MKNRKLTPLEKLSKWKKGELAAKQRGTWGGVNPVTRKSPLSGSYRRSKERQITRKEFQWACE